METIDGIAQEGLSVQARGQFQPLLLSPIWFQKQDLVGPSEISACNIELMTPELSVFELGWLRVQVSNEFIQFTTEFPEEFEPLRDVAIGTLRALGSIPLSRISVHRFYHATRSSRHKIDLIGDALAPKVFWSESVLNPATKDVTIWAGRDDSWTGRVQITVQPSNIVPQAVFILVNDQYSLDFGQPASSRSEESWDLDDQASSSSVEKYAVALQILEEGWQQSLNRSDKIQNSILKLGEG